MDKDLSLLYEIKEIKSLLKNIEKRLDDIEDEVLGESMVLNKEHHLYDVWSDAKDIIKNELTEVSFNTWIKPITLCKIEENTIFLQLCNDFSKGILEARYIDLLNNAIYQATGSTYNIKFVIKD